MQNEKPKQSIMVAVDVLMIDRFLNKVLLIKRKDTEMLAMVGGMVEDDETLETAAVREFGEEVGLHLRRDQLRYIGYADRVDRDPRQRVISHVFTVHVDKWMLPDPVAGDDAKEVDWYDIENIFANISMWPENFFADHGDIIRKAVEKSSLSL